MCDNVKGITVEETTAVRYTTKERFYSDDEIRDLFPGGEGSIVRPLLDRALAAEEKLEEWGMVREAAMVWRKARDEADEAQAKVPPPKAGGSPCLRAEDSRKKARKVNEAVRQLWAELFKVVDE
jgi:hypothetical protein